MTKAQEAAVSKINGVNYKSSDRNKEFLVSDFCIVDSFAGGGGASTGIELDL